MKQETRFKTTELRVTKAFGKPPIISGYALVYERESEPIGGMFVERIRKGAAKKALRKSDTRALINHDDNLILGRKSAGTLKLREDDTGVFMEIEPPDTSYARDLMVSIERGDIQEQSFRFIVAEGGDEWTEPRSKMPVRTITEFLAIDDVSPVTFPAYPDTTVAVRSLKQAKDAVTGATQVLDIVTDAIGNQSESVLNYWKQEDE